MKRLALIFLIVFGFHQAWARTIYVTGRGSASTSCASNNSFCLSQLKDRAEREGQRDAQWRCQMERGQSLTYTLSCYTRCNPSILPPNMPSVFVSCTSDCRMSCEIKG